MTPKKKKNPIHYVDNKKFYEEIVKYYAEIDDAKRKNLPPPRIPDYLGECIMKISNKLSEHPWFSNYSFKDEMISDGIENCILYFHSYDPNKKKAGSDEAIKNPFAYFTQITYFAFRRRIQREEKNRYTIYKSFQESMMDPSLMIDSDDTSLMNKQIYDNINDFMKKFEEKEKEKKKKRIKGKIENDKRKLTDAISDSKSDRQSSG